MSGTHNMSRAKMVTWCPDCQRDQGVVRDSFNRSSDMQAWRLTKHTNKKTKMACTNSRAIVHENNVWPNEKMSTLSA